MPKIHPISLNESSPKTRSMKTSLYGSFILWRRSWILSICSFWQYSVSRLLPSARSSMLSSVSSRFSLRRWSIYVFLAIWQSQEKTLVLSLRSFSFSRALKNACCVTSLAMVSLELSLTAKEYTLEKYLFVQQFYFEQIFTSLYNYVRSRKVESIYMTHFKGSTFLFHPQKMSKYLFDFSS